jgi:hypothetical protein
LYVVLFLAQTCQMIDSIVTIHSLQVSRPLSACQG